MRRKKKKLQKRKIIILVLLIICLIVGYISNIVLTNRNLTVFEKAIKDSFLTIQRVITFPVDFVVEKINISKEKNKMYEEYEDLKNKLLKLQIFEIENEELKKQIEEMKSILNLNNVLSDFDSINATVIGRDLSYWNDNIILDKGENDGISVNMPVVVANGLIGKVVKTTTFNSTVRLLTANNSNDKISVKIKNNGQYIYGILSKYDKKSNMYIIEGIAQNVEMEKGALVTTTGMGDIYPSGIVIGKVKEINTDNFDLSKILEVESDIDFDEISYVKVLKRGDI